MSPPPDPGAEGDTAGSSRPVVLVLAIVLSLVLLYVLWGRVSGAAFWTIAIALNVALALVEVRFSTEPDQRARLRTLLQNLLGAPLALFLYVLWNRVSGIAFWTIAGVTLAALKALTLLLAFWLHDVRTRRGNSGQ